jgi:hypothetical protein
VVPDDQPFADKAIKTGLPVGRSGINKQEATADAVAF